MPQYRTRVRRNFVCLCFLVVVSLFVLLKRAVDYTFFDQGPPGIESVLSMDLVVGQGEYFPLGDKVQKALLASHVQILLQESPSDGAFSSFYYRNRLRMLQGLRKQIRKETKRGKEGEDYFRDVQEFPRSALWRAVRVHLATPDSSSSDHDSFSFAQSRNWTASPSQRISCAAVTKELGLRAAEEGGKRKLGAWEGLAQSGEGAKNAKGSDSNSNSRSSSRRFRRLSLTYAEREREKARKEGNNNKGNNKELSEDLRKKKETGTALETDAVIVDKNADADNAQNGNGDGNNLGLGAKNSVQDRDVAKDSSDTGKKDKMSSSSEDDRGSKSLIKRKTQIESGADIALAAPTDAGTGKTGKSESSEPKAGMSQARSEKEASPAPTKILDVIILSGCVGEQQTLAVSRSDSPTRVFDEIYPLYDRVVALAISVRKANPGALIVWDVPTLLLGWETWHGSIEGVPLDDAPKYEESALIHNYVMLKHLVHDLGVMAVPNAAAAQGYSIGLSNLLANMNMAMNRNADDVASWTGVGGNHADLLVESTRHYLSFFTDSSVWGTKEKETESVAPIEEGESDVPNSVSKSKGAKRSLMTQEEMLASSRAIVPEEQASDKADSSSVIKNRVTHKEKEKKRRKEEQWHFEDTVTAAKSARSSGANDSNEVSPNDIGMDTNTTESSGDKAGTAVGKGIFTMTPKNGQNSTIDAPLTKMDEERLQGGEEKAGVAALVKSTKALTKGGAKNGLALRPYYSNTYLSDACSHLLNTRKYDSRCFPIPSHAYPLLVTGLGGSGTHAIAYHLQEAGIAVKHEELDRHGAVCWMYATNDVYSHTTYPFHAKLDSTRSLLSPRFKYVVHAVRAPLTQISSFTSHLNASYEFLLTSLQQEPYARSAVAAQLEQQREKEHKANTTSAVLLKENLWATMERVVNSTTSLVKAGTEVVAFPKRRKRDLEKEKEKAKERMAIHSETLEREREGQWFLRLSEEMQRRRGCGRGMRCNLPVAALAWMLWNRHIDSYADYTYRVDFAPGMEGRAVSAGSTSTSTERANRANPATDLRLDLGAGLSDLLDVACRRVAKHPGEYKKCLSLANKSVKMEQRREQEAFLLAQDKDKQSASESESESDGGRLRVSSAPEAAISKVHKVHQEYSAADVENEDKKLWAAIKAVSETYGYSNENMDKRISA